MNNSIRATEEVANENETVLQQVHPAYETVTLTKNDLVIQLQDDNQSLYAAYMDCMKRNMELRVIVEKQQKLINAIYNAELNVLLPQQIENHTTALVPVAVEKQLQPGVEEKTFKPLESHLLIKRIKGLRKQKIQLKGTLLSKSDLLMLLYKNTEPLSPTAIVTATGLVRITAFRYMAFFKDFGFVRYGGTNKKGGYRITAFGRRFVEGQPITKDDIDRDRKKKLRLHF